MEPYFDLETPVLHYALRAHAKPGPRNQRVWLLWPAFAYRVVAPQFERPKINALQQAVIGVLRASRLTEAELGVRLGVHPELAKFVVVELQGQGRIDGAWRITERGVEVLDEQRDAAANLVPGWVFQDPWTHALWPVVTASLEYARTQRSEGGYLDLEFGTTGTPWLQRTWMQLPGWVESPEPPGAREIMRAAAAGGRLARRASRLELADDDDGIGSALARVDPDRVSMIEPKPTPVFLTTYLYVPSDGSELDWYVCDCFGRGASTDLRRLISKLANDDDRLAAQLDRLLQSTLGHGFDEQRRAAQGRSTRARRLMERALTVDVCTHSIAEPMAEVFEGLLELRELGEGAGLRRRRDVLTGCRLTLERLFQRLGETWSIVGIAERLSRDDKSFNAALVRAAAADLHLADPPVSMCKVQPGHVRSAATNGRLRAIVVAHLLAAQGQPEHPLRAAAAQAPDLLERIDFVANAAGAAVHDGGESKVERSDIDRVVQTCVEIVGHICRLPTRPLQDLLNDG